MEDLFKREQCLKTFTKKHIGNSHIENVYSCHLCQQTFIAKTYQHSHRVAVHSTKNMSYTCDYCRKKFFSKELVESNIICTIEKKMCCEHCNKILDSKHTLKQHINNNHRVQICKHCNQVFKSYYYLQQHKQTIHNNVRYECHYCKKIFGSKCNLRTHMNSVCLKKRTCDKCDKVFSNNYHLEQHFNEVHKKITYKCEICGRYLTTKYILKRHMSRVHADRKNLVCDKCCENFTSKRQLENHINIVHKCTHVICSYCQNPFKSTNIKKHIAAKHMSTKYVCNHCHKTFRKKQLLMSHLFMYKGHSTCINAVDRCSEETTGDAAVKREPCSLALVKSEPESTFEITSEPSTVKSEPLDVTSVSSIHDDTCFEFKQEPDDIDIGPVSYQRITPVNFKMQSKSGKNMYLIKKQDYETIVKNLIYTKKQ